jgi:hypothetical protein
VKGAKIPAKEYQFTALIIVSFPQLILSEVAQKIFNGLSMPIQSLREGLQQQSSQHVKTGKKS